MDFTQQCLSLAPVPFLATAFSGFRFIWSSVEQAQANKRQQQALIQSIAQLLHTLDNQYRVGRLMQDRTLTHLAELSRLLAEISSFVQKEATYPYLKLLFSKGRRISRIEGYHRHLGNFITSFQISALVDVQAWKARNDNAVEADRRELHDRMYYLETNNERLIQVLNVHQMNVRAIIVALQKRLQTGSVEDRDRRFFTHALQYLTTRNGQQVEVEHWMITSYEVEYGQEIGSGGFGQVFKGTWNRTKVAIKVLVMKDGVVPSYFSMRNEVDIWSNIRHPNIIQFLGANILDEKPFIVMPYLKNGNCRAFLQEHPDTSRLQILYDVSLGLAHLHSHQIVHGDLKGFNVLIDDSPKAVLCDFGLSQVRADVTSRTVFTGGSDIIGSPNWMAPELFQGESLKGPCDIYAFGMTLYEIFADEIPLSYIRSAGLDFVDLVVHRGVRPKRPEREVAPQLSNQLWELAERCWVKDPKHRPTASAVCDTLNQSFEATAVAPQVVLPSQWSTLPYGPTQVNVPRPLTPPPQRTMRGHEALVACTAFSPDGNYAASGSVDGTIIVWDVRTGELALGPLKKHNAAVFSLAFHPNGRKIASGHKDCAILIWDLQMGQAVVGPFLGHTDEVWGVCFSPTGNELASGSKDKTVRLWNAHSGHLIIRPLIGHVEGVHSVTFSGEGTQLVSGSNDKTIRVWDVESGKPSRGPLRGHKSWVYFAGFSPDGKRIVSASSEGDICVWDTDQGTLISGPSKSHTEGTAAALFMPTSNCCAISPDGKWVAGYSDSSGRKFRVWDSRTGRPARKLTEQTHYVSPVSFSPDSKRIISASDDTTLQLHSLDLIY